MNTFAIHEDNFDRLEKKLNNIKNKCNKFGFKYEFNVVGEEFRNVEDSTQRFIMVEVEGEVKFENYEFVGLVEKTPSGSNVIRTYTDYDLEQYRDVELECEHCNTKHYRTKVLIVRNVDTGEMKMVGSSCLKLYTKGLDANDIAGYISSYDSLIQGECVQGPSTNVWFDIKKTLVYSFEVVEKFGYIKRDSQEPYTTLDMVLGVRDLQQGSYVSEKLQKIFDEANLITDQTKLEEKFGEKVENMLSWLNGETFDNMYLNNVKSIVSSEYAKQKDLALLVSSVTSYNRHEEWLSKQKRIAEVNKQSNSDYVGNIGDKISFSVVGYKLITSYTTQYGTTFVNSFTDENENVFVWKTGKSFDEDVVGKTLKGTVKGHAEFNGLKQTQVLRCSLK